MRFAVLSDIHSNYAALRAVIADAESRQPDYWLFLGDYVTDCPYPHRTVEFLRDFSQNYLLSYDTRQPRGLHDKSAESPAGVGIRLKMRSAPLLLRGSHRRRPRLAGFAAVHAAPGASRLRAVHNVPRFTGQHKLPVPHQYPGKREIMISRLGEYGCRLMLCGHSHIPFIFKREGRMLVNPGALGMPVNEQTKAQYAFLTYNGEWNPEIISVDYDIERTAEEFSSSGLLEKSAVWGRGLLGTIRTGINYTVLAVRLVEKYSQETGLPVTDESLWERAAKELQIP